ncbi:MAG: ankyrin repeat domain-containing protein [Vicinamibacterales bacterium]
MIRIALLALATSIAPLQATSAINQEDALKLTLLMRAAAKGDLEAVNALVAKGADPNVQSSQQGITALMCAAYFGQLEVVKVLVAKGAKIDLKDHNGGGAVDWAVAGERDAVDQWLEAQGAVINPFLNLFSFPVSFMDLAAGKKP